MATDAPLLKELLISIFLRRGIAFLDGNGWLLPLPALQHCGGEMGYFVLPVNEDRWKVQRRTENSVVVWKSGILFALHQLVTIAQ